MSPATNRGADFGDVPEPEFATEVAVVDVDSAIGRIRDHTLTLWDIIGGLSPDQWSNTVIANGEPRTIDWAARHVVHDVFHHLDDIATIRRRLGDGVGPMTGRVDQISSSTGGVPKTAVPTAEIGLDGVVGDGHNSRQHHGRPWQALCLFSAEAIDTFVEEGHPISAGCVGENLTLRGIDWGSLRQGTILQVGDVRMRLSAPAVPCFKNNGWFSDGDANHLSYEQDPARARWYASVLTPGTIAEGASILVEPAS